MTYRKYTQGISEPEDMSWCDFFSDLLPEFEGKVSHMLGWVLFVLITSLILYGTMLELETDASHVSAPELWNVLICVTVAVLAYNLRHLLGEISRLLSRLVRLLFYGAGMAVYILGCLGLALIGCRKAYATTTKLEDVWGRFGTHMLTQFEHAIID